MIDLSFLKDRKIAVLGLGRTGLSAARALRAGGADVLAWDDHEPRRAAAEAENIPLADLYDVPLEGVESLVLSPGIPHTSPKPHPVAERFGSKGIEIISDIELLRRSDSVTDVIGVTGTNGKSTTTALVGHILEAAMPVELGGNIGVPVLDFTGLKSRAEEGGRAAYVLELSSYQLEMSPSLRARGAVWLNISADHLDRHGGFEGYVAAKKCIFANPPAEGQRPVAVIGVDDAASRRVAQELKDQGGWRVIAVSVHERPAGGVYLQDGRLIDDAGDGRAEVFELAQARRLKGVHNHQNIACAYAVTRYVCNLPPEEIVARIVDFEGLPHRQYLVATVAGVAYINDSKATNPVAASHALASFRNIYWIAGGRPKEGTLDALEPHLGRVKHAFLIGEAMRDFASWLDKRGIPCNHSETLEIAVQEAHRMAQSGRGQPGGTGTVLLSPACASFDQFSSFEERGEKFAACVRALAAQAEEERGGT